MNRILKHIPRFNTTSTVFNLGSASFLIFAANVPFWHVFITKLGLTTSSHWVLLVVVGVTLWMMLNILLSLFSFRPIYKPLLTVLFCTAAVVSYFMDSYGIVIDNQMITNLFETNFNEATEQLTWPLLVHFFLMGVLPSVLLLQTRISYRPWRSELLVRGGVILASTVLLVAMIKLNFKEIVLFTRQNRDVRMYINPTYPIYSLIKTMSENRKAFAREPPKVIGEDAKKTVSSRKSAVVLVVGESARAEEFSLNGYSRITNPQLSTRDVITFTDVQSCGTDTAESVPCMFFHSGKAHYSRNEAKRYENLLDVLQRAGVQVIWRDNNSGSKGVGDRIRYENMSEVKDNALCSKGECYDEILLKDLDKLLSQNSGNMLVVLHQKGSHGPAYYKRTPKDLKRFLPECENDNVQDCDRQSIINAYDNTIVYTDYILSNLIKLLNNQKYATAMLYVSDHGESLGENNVYLHGFPYAIAPKQQTQIPMIFWASNSFLQENTLDMALLGQHRSDHFSHDNLFHSLLGLFRVTTGLYHPELDLFQAAHRQKL